MAPNHLSHLLPFVVDHAIVLATEHIVHQYCETAAIAFPASSRLLLMRVLVIWQAMALHHILENIVKRVEQYVDDRCLADKWYLGDMIT